jgi:hypothetical protein
MAKINVVHVGVGGVVAGIVINVIARAAWNYLLPNGMMAGSYLWGFVVAMVTVCLYSALSARRGPSPARAVMAGVIVWVFVIALPNYGFLALETLSSSLVTMSLVLGIVAIVPAALAGALTYDWFAATRLARAPTHQAHHGLRVRLARLTPHTPLSVKAV